MRCWLPPRPGPAPGCRRVTSRTSGMPLRRYLAAGAATAPGTAQLERCALPDGPGRFGRIDGLLRGINRAAVPADPRLLRRAEMVGCRRVDGIRHQRQRALPAEHING